MIREDKIVKLRPFIGSIETDHKSSESEEFQNLVLRPILKFQNDILISIIKENNHYNSLLKEINSDADSLTAIKHFLNKETQLKHTVIGILIGLCTLPELAFYNKNFKELNKRITQMVAQRFFDNKNFQQN